jgi:hypothetical protein
MIGMFMAGRSTAKYLSSPTYVRWLSRNLQLRSGSVSKALYELEGVIRRDKFRSPAEKQHLREIISIINSHLNSQISQQTLAYGSRNELQGQQTRRPWR